MRACQDLAVRVKLSATTRAGPSTTRLSRSLLVRESSGAIQREIRQRYSTGGPEGRHQAGEIGPGHEIRVAGDGHPERNRHGKQHEVVGLQGEFEGWRRQV